jgi:phytoene dehydrogenase-like protein
LGGRIHYQSQVSKILVEKGDNVDHAVGIRLQDGSEYDANQVISNADGHTTIYDMLGGKYTTSLIKHYYDNPPKNQEMSLNIFLGINNDFSSEPHSLVLWLPEPVVIAGETRDRLDLEFFSFAPEMAPGGKTTLKVTFISSYKFWKNLQDQNEDAYHAAKEKTAEIVISLLDRRFPGLKEKVEVVDIATPLTTERYVGSYHGYQAWGIPNQSFLDAISGKGLSKTLPGLANFHMVGQWAGGLGLPNVAAMGRKTIIDICKKDGQPFKTLFSSEKS